MPSNNKRPGEEVEGNEKKKAGASSRTGQACDRCKIRKIRCDARPGGCSPCLQNNTECKTTDRITGRATSRGHAEHLEHENSALKMYMVELQQQLREHGLEPKPPPNASNAYTVPSSQQHAYYEPAQQAPGSWGDLSAGTAGLMPMASNANGERKSSQSSAALPNFRPGSGDNYLGVSCGDDWLSPIEGTSLALFGMKIDIADFLPAESDPTVSAMSYQTFLSHAFRKTQPTYPPQLPPYEDCKVYSEWYFRAVQVFVPVLHKPEFMKLLQRVCHGQHEPNPAETVMLHMVIAIMKFQYSSRNGTEQLRNEAMNHYHYAVNFIPELTTGHTLQDIQALVVIACQLRNQPQPGAAWIFIHNVFGLCIELGLHRSANAWQTPSSERDAHTIEMRKRIFWTILCLHVNIGSKLGRPMPIRLEDFDIEIPEAAADNSPGESNVSKWRKCSFRAAIHGFKLVRILMQVHSTVYSIRSGTEPYDLSIQNLDKQLDNFRAQLPPEFAGGSQTVDEDRIPALYLQAVEHATRLLIHHPSLSRSMSPQIMERNLDVCLDASSKMLAVTLRLKGLKSLDTTWHQATEYLAAIFTTLFAYTQRRESMGSEDLARLRGDMEAWLEVVADVGVLLGAGLRLRDAVKNVIDSCINDIARHLAARTASAGLASSGSPTSASTEQPPQQLYTNANGFADAYGNGSIANNTQQHQPSYPQPNNAFYAETHANGTMPAYSSAAPMPTFDSAAFGSEDMKPNIQLNTHQPATQLQQQSPNAYVNQSLLPAQNMGWNPTHNLNHGPAAWRVFANDMMTNMPGGQEYSVPAGHALIGNGVDVAAAGMVGGGVGVGAMQMPVQDGVGGQQPWPLNMYSTPGPGPGGGVGDQGG